MGERVLQGTNKPTNTFQVVCIIYPLMLILYVYFQMKDLVQFGCNHRKDEQRDKVVCYFKATYAAPEAGSGKKRRGFIEYIRSLFRG